MKHIFLTFIYLSFAFQMQGQDYKDILSQESTVSQDTTPYIGLLAEYRDNRMWLRWAPNDHALWAMSTLTGYKLERFELDENQLPLMESIDSIIIKPWEINKFRPYNDGSNEKMLVMGESVHGLDYKNMAESDGFGGNERELINRHGFALVAAEFDFEVSVAGGLGWIDKNVVANKNYFYRVTSLATNIKSKPGFLTINATEVPIPAPILKNAIEDEGKVTLQWTRAYHEDKFSGYWIEKSKDNRSYERTTKQPYVGTYTDDFPSTVFTYVDSLKNYDSYYYRLVGVTPFSRLSLPSREVQLMARDKTGCGEVKNVRVLTDVLTQEVLVDWDRIACDDLDGYLIERALEVDGVYELKTLKPIKNNSYREKVDNINLKHYYRVSSIDTAGNAIASLSFLAAFRDTIAPQNPAKPNGSMDTLGHVTLNWKANTEPDLAGYHVYRANSSSHVFTLINATPHTSTTFVDTVSMQTLTEQVYYKITAADFNGHISEFSPELKVDRPDAIAPFPPSIISFTQEDKMIVIEWSTSKSKDVVTHKMYRAVDQGNYIELRDFSADKAMYVDEDVESGKTYNYKIIAIDDAGLKSIEYAKASLKYVDRSVPLALALSSCKLTAPTSTSITWQPSQDKKTTQIIVFRSVNGGKMSVLGRVQKGSSYEDKTIKKGYQYSYAVKQKWSNGKKSPMSNTMSVQVD